MFLRFALFLIPALIIIFGAHFLLYFSIIRIFGPFSPNLKSALGLIFIFLSLSFIIAIFLVYWRENLLTEIFYILASFWVGLIINLLLASAATWALIGIIKLTGHNGGRLYLGILFFTLAVLYSLYGVWNALNPRIKNIEVAINNLPEVWRGKTIVQLSDVHLGHVHGKKFLADIINKTNGLSPDLIFITGDLFDGMGDNLASFVEPLNNLESAKGIFFITGNHENYLGVDKILPIFKKTKITVLDDKAVNIDGLQIIGLSYPGFGEVKNVKSIIKSDGNFKKGAPTILLYHTPTNIEEEQKDAAGRQWSTYWSPDSDFTAAKELGVNLQLSGHTHKGQIFPFGLVTKLVYKNHDYGLYQDGNFFLYTTSGAGTWGPPMRTGNKPEIAAIKLK